ncbi:MoxR family ATPase [bacterium]|nr:MAG: MoxR family ATPase [bacterium]
METGQDRAAWFRTTFDAVRTEVRKAIVGQDEVLENALIGLATSGHILLEGMPGLGKTLLVRSLGQALSLPFGRIQFTPDMMPADVTGTNVLSEGRQFEFRRGPIFANLLLADEINRATPKTQSAMLEAMQERAVTVGGKRYELTEPFLVLATQNPVEQEGTYPLPEAQLDRFFSRLSLGYPDRASEIAVLGARTTDQPLDELRSVTDLNALLAMQEGVRHVFVHDRIREYVVDVVRATRESNQLLMGASPRGSLQLMRAAQAWAALQGDDRVLPDHVKAMAGPVLAHRVIGRAELRTQGQSTEDLVKRLVESVNAPTT